MFGKFTYKWNLKPKSPRHKIPQITQRGDQPLAMLLRQGLRIGHRADKRADVIAAHAQRDQLPVVLEAYPPVATDPLDQRLGHVRQIGRHGTDLGHIELGVLVKGIRIVTWVTEQFAVERFENVGQSGRIAPTPLAADAPREATVLHEQILHSSWGGARRGSQRIAKCGDYIKVTFVKKKKTNIYINILKFLQNPFFLPGRKRCTLSGTRSLRICRLHGNASWYGSWRYRPDIGWWLPPTSRKVMSRNVWNRVRMKAVSSIEVCSTNSLEWTETDRPVAKKRHARAAGHCVGMTVI